MYDARDFLREIKASARDEREESKPCDVLQGTVLSASPLTIQISSKIILDEDFLIVPQHLTNYKVPVDVDWETESKSGGSAEAAFASHTHDIKGTFQMTIRNALKEDDTVLLLRQNGGQNFIVLDRIGD